MKRSRSMSKPLPHAVVKQGLFSGIFGWGTGIRTPTAWARTRCSTLKLSPNVVPKVGFEPTRGHPHYALNVARLPIPPLRPTALIIQDSQVLYLHRVHSPIGARCPRIGGMEAKQLKAELMKEMEAEIDELVESYKHSGPLTMTQLRYWQHENA